MKYTAEIFDGPVYNSNQYMHRRGVQIVATEKGTRRYVFQFGRSKSPCYKMGTWACHYKSGLNKADRKRLEKTLEEAQTLAEEWTAKGTHK